MPADKPIQDGGSSYGYYSQYGGSSNTTPTNTNSNGNTGSSFFSKNYSMPDKYNNKAADAMLIEALNDALGFAPNAALLKKFRAGLKDFMKKYGSRSTSTTRSSGTSQKTVSQQTQGADANAYLKQFIGTVASDMLRSKPNIQFGGAAGELQRKLSTDAADMGLFKGTNELASMVSDTISMKKNPKDLTNSFRKEAIVLYKNFADRLQTSDLTVRDLANPYIQMMADTFEGTADKIMLTDDTIQKAIGGDKLLSLGEFRSTLRADSRFQKTLTAKREASELATSMLNAFRGIRA